MLGYLKAMNDKEIELKIKIEYNMETIFDVDQYYQNHFSDNIRHIIRYFSIYSYFYQINQSSELTNDYYKLLMLQLRKFFSPKMETKYKIGSKRQDINDHELTFAQWIDKYIMIIDKEDFDNSFNVANKENIMDASKALIKTLGEFNKIYSDNQVKDEDGIIEYSLRNRIYNYSNKFVAHDSGMRRIEEYEYDNYIFVKYSEIYLIVKLFSRIEENYLIFRNYYSNTVKIKENLKPKDFRVKIMEYQTEFLKESFNSDL